MITCHPEVAARRARLLNVAKALEDANEVRQLRETFSMHWYTHTCGTPMCALGHYAARQDLQSAFKLSGGGYLGSSNGKRLFGGIDSLEVVTHFGLEAGEPIELFSPSGCGNAKTPLQAAKYIRDFVDRKYPAWRKNG